MDDEGCVVLTTTNQLNRDLQGHLYVGRLTKEEKNMVTDMTNNLTKLKGFLRSDQSKNPDSHTKIKQIYNAHLRIHSSQREGQ